MKFLSINNFETVNVDAQMSVPSWVHGAIVQHAHDPNHVQAAELREVRSQLRAGPVLHTDAAALPHQGGARRAVPRQRPAQPRVRHSRGKHPHQLVI